MNWTVRHRGVLLGTLPESEIRRCISENKLTSMDEVSADGHTWLRIRQTSLWQPAAAPASAPSAAPAASPPRLTAADLHRRRLALGKPTALPSAAPQPAMAVPGPESQVPNPFANPPPSEMPSPYPPPLRDATPLSAPLREGGASEASRGDYSVQGDQEIVAEPVYAPSAPPSPAPSALPPVIINIQNIPQPLSQPAPKPEPAPQPEPPPSSPQARQQPVLVIHADELRATQNQLPPNIPSHMVKAWVTFFIFSRFCGIVAIIYAFSVRKSIKKGLYRDAMEASRKANSWANWGIGISLVANTIIMSQLH